jgi:hypothetical protein
METSAAPLQRPVFLTILCVLTFFGSTMGIMGGLSDYNDANVKAELTRQMIDQEKDKALDKAETASQRSMMEKLFSGSDQMMDTRKIKQNGLFTVMSNIMTLLGAIMMFRLKRTGFGFYVIGTIVYVLAPLLIFGGKGFFAMVITMALGFMGIIFVILYALNIKHMK